MSCGNEECARVRHAVDQVTMAMRKAHDSIDHDDWVDELGVAALAWRGLVEAFQANADVLDREWRGGRGKPCLYWRWPAVHCECGNCRGRWRKAARS